MLKNQQNLKWYQQTKWSTVLALAALLAAYGLGSRALFTGSLQQYALAIVSLVFAINRIAHLVILAFAQRKTA